MSNRLEGKVAIVTGTGTGLGEAIAHKFAHEGARFVVNGCLDDPREFLSVPDLDAAVRWYVDKLDFAVINRYALPEFSTKAAFLESNDFRVELAVIKALDKRS